MVHIAKFLSSGVNSTYTLDFSEMENYRDKTINDFLVFFEGVTTYSHTNNNTVGVSKISYNSSTGILTVKAISYVADADVVIAGYCID